MLFYKFQLPGRQRKIRPNLRVGERGGEKKRQVELEREGRREWEREKIQVVFEREVRWQWEKKERELERGDMRGERERYRKKETEIECKEDIEEEN